jgi:phosphatidylserine decarboxylase
MQTAPQRLAKRALLPSCRPPRRPAAAAISLVCRSHYSWRVWRDWSRGLALGALRGLPLHLLSRAAGACAALHLPPPLQRAQIRLFGRLVGVDFAEVADPIESFPSLQAFFTRRLADGARPIDPDPEAVVAPCDGAWGAAGSVRRGTLLQVKGRPYSLGALLGSDRDAAAFEGGSFATFYLSPRDYHRFHAPCEARVTRARYIPGALWPVNDLGVRGVEGLFAQNERICAFMRVARGGAGSSLCAVAVGATLVGKVRLCFDELCTGARGGGAERAYPDGGHALAKGEEWGRFEFGSSLILVAAPELIRLDAQAHGAALRLGSRIGSLRAPGAGVAAGDTSTGR